jgi:hypothetical protein
MATVRLRTQTARIAESVRNIILLPPLIATGTSARDRSPDPCVLVYQGNDHARCKCLKIQVFCHSPAQFLRSGQLFPMQFLRASFDREISQISRIDYFSGYQVERAA